MWRYLVQLTLAVALAAPIVWGLDFVSPDITALGIGGILKSLIGLPAASLQELIVRLRPSDHTALAAQVIDSVSSILGLDAAQVVVASVTIGPLVGRIRPIQGLANRLTDGPPAFLRPARKGEAPGVSAANIRASEVLRAFAAWDVSRGFFGLFGSDRATNRAIAFAWLDKLRRSGWHSGVLGNEIPANWRPVRNTAIFVDDYFFTGDELWEALERFQAALGAEKGPKVRILFSSRVDLPSSAQARGRAAFREIMLRRFEPTTGAADTADAEASPPPADQPRAAQFAIEMGLRRSRRRRSSLFAEVRSARARSESAELVDQAARRFGTDGLRLMAMAAATGPTPARVRVLLAPDAGDLQGLAALFPGAPPEELLHVVPSIPPGERMEVLVHCLERLQEVERENFGALLVHERPEAASDIDQMISDWIRDQVTAAQAVLKREADRDSAASPRGRKPAPDGGAPGSEILAATELPSILESLLFPSRSRRTIATRWLGDALRPIVDQQLRALVGVDLMADLVRLRTSRGPSTVAERPLGHLLEPLIKPAYDVATPSFTRPIWRLISALAPTLLRRGADLDVVEFLTFLSECEGELGIRDDLALIARCPDWTSRPTAVAALLDLIFDHLIREQADVIRGPELQPSFSDFRESGGPLTEDPHLDEALQPVAQAFVLLDDAFVQRDKEGDDAWRQRLADAEPNLLSLLAGADPVGQLAAVWALNWVVRVWGFAPGLAAPSDRLTAALVACAGRAEAPPAVWRRAAAVLVKLAHQDASADELHRWAEAVDAGRPLDLPERRPTFQHPALGAALDEARRRLRDVGTAAERRSAAALLLSYGENDEIAAQTLCSACRHPTADEDTISFLVLILARAGRSATRNALKRLVLEGRGHAAFMGFLGLCALRGHDELFAVADAPLQLEGPYQAAIERLITWRPGSAMAEASDAADTGFADILLMPKTVVVLLVRGEDPDKAPIYAYVGVRADRLARFMRAQSEGLFFPEEHGVVIEAGAGEPPAEVRERMERDYGFRHDTMQDVEVGTAAQLAASMSRKANAPPATRDPAPEA